jgi:predicted aconitase with swiveling domain
VREQRALVAGSARAPALLLEEPLSFWGGVDPGDGRIIDSHHPQAGQVVSGRVLVMPSGRGSSSSSSVLAEAIRAGTAPAAILMRSADEIVALGALVALELYGIALPVVVLDEESYGRIRSGDVVEIGCEGTSARVTLAAVSGPGPEPPGAPP